MKASLIRACTLALIGSAYAGEPGTVGLRLDNSDFRVVAHVAAGSPAARAGVQTGDRITAVNGYPTSQLHNVGEFSRRADGPAGAELELQLQRFGASQLLVVRMRRVPMRAIDLGESHGEITYPDGHVEVIPFK